MSRMRAWRKGQENLRDLHCPSRYNLARLDRKTYRPEKFMRNSKSFHLNRKRKESGVAFLKWLVIIAIVVLGGWGFWMYANQQKLRMDLDEAQAQSTQLQEEKQGLEQRLAQLAKPVEDPNSLELIKLRAEVARLRNLERQHQAVLSENQQLKATVQQLQQVNAETIAIFEEGSEGRIEELTIKAKMVAFE